MKAAMLVGEILFAALFVARGVGHFVATDVNLKMMPPTSPASTARPFERSH